MKSLRKRVATDKSIVVVLATDAELAMILDAVNARASFLKWNPDPELAPWEKLKAELIEARYGRMAEHAT